MRIWTPEEVQRLEELIADGKSIADIMAGLNRAQGSVKMKMRQLGLKTQRSWSAKDVEFLREAVSKGFADKRIASELGRSEMAIFMKKTKLGLRSARYWKEKDDKELEFLWRAGLPANQIAILLRRTQRSVFHRAERLELPSRPRYVMLKIRVPASADKSLNSLCDKLGVRKTEYIRNLILKDISEGSVYLKHIEDSVKRWKNF